MAHVLVLEIEFMVSGSSRNDMKSICLNPLRTTKTMGWAGLIRVDNTTFIWMGRPSEAGEIMAPIAMQTAAFTTPTQTHFLIKAGPIDLNVTFFSPVEIDDIPRQSIPLSYVWVDVVANDGMAHDVQVYMDISGAIEQDN